MLLSVTLSLLCIIPARGNSKRFPGKNLAMLGGKPLLAHSIDAAKQSGLFASVCVSSDNTDILACAERYGAVPLARPMELAGDDVGIAPVCVQVLEFLEKQGQSFDAFAMLQATSPLRTGADIVAAYALLRGEADAVLSVTRCAQPPQRSLKVEGDFLKPFFSAAAMEKVTQGVEPLYFSNGAVDIVKTDVFLREKTFFVQKAVPYIMPEERSVDIDERVHLAWAEFLLSRTGLT